MSAPARGTGEICWPWQGWDRDRNTEQQILEQKRVPLPCQLGALLTLHPFFPLLPPSISSQQPYFSKDREKSLPLSCLQAETVPLPLPEHPPLTCPKYPPCNLLSIAHSLWPPQCLSPSLLQGTSACQATHCPAQQSYASSPPCTPWSAAVLPLPASRYPVPCPASCSQAVAQMTCAQSPQRPLQRGLE